MTSVRWSVDNADITTDSPLFSQTITLVDRLTATYQLVLSGDISNFVGTFSCEIIDGNGRRSSASQAINGITFSPCIRIHVPFLNRNNTLSPYIRLLSERAERGGIILYSDENQ